MPTDYGGSGGGVSSYELAILALERGLFYGVVRCWGMLRSSQYITVVVENNRVNVAGRVYESGHVMLVGAVSLSASISYGSIRAEAVFPFESQVESTSDDVVKVQAPESKFEVDTLGSSIREVRREDSGVTLTGQIISIKFESDDEYNDIVVKIPKYKKLRAKRVDVRSSKKTTLNMMTTPFTIGVLTAYDATCTVRSEEDSIVIEIK